MSKIYLNFSFNYKCEHESRFDYIQRLIAESIEYISYYDADILEIKGFMFKNDIKNFKRILKTEPVSNKYQNNHLYKVKFVIPTKKLIDGDSVETSAY